MEFFDIQLKHVGNCYGKNQHKPLKEIFREICNYFPHKKFIIKIFYEHLEFISKNRILELLNLDIDKKVIILQRNMKDTYNSLCLAVKTNKWGNTNTPIPPRKYTQDLIIDYDTYEKNITQWYIDIIIMLENLNIVYTKLQFTDIIKHDFEIKL